MIRSPFKLNYYKHHLTKFFTPRIISVNGIVMDHKHHVISKKRIIVLLVVVLLTVLLAGGMLFYTMGNSKFKKGQINEPYNYNIK
jgi:hypothetical protein